MNITFTRQEIETFETKLNMWHASLAMNILQWKRDPMFARSENEKEFVQRVIRDFTKDNPKPRWFDSFV